MDALEDRVRRWLKRALPKTMTQREAISLLKEHGWTQTLGGKHDVKMAKAEERPITLPSNHGEKYPKGLTLAILKQAGLKP